MVNNLSRAKKGVMWSGIQQVSISGIHFLITIFLARLLSPSDYGLIAMLSIFFAFSQAFVDSGLSGALIQKNEISNEDYNAVFFFSITISIVLYLILFICAPLISLMFKSPQLTDITRFYMLDLIINAVCMVPFAKLQRELMFNYIAKITTTTSLLSGCIAIWMAYSGFAYWALVAQVLLASSINAICYWYIIKWKPHFHFSYESLKSMMSFGVPVMLTAMVNSIYNNIYSLVIGGKYTATDLGYYNRSYSFASFIPTNFSACTLRALFPVFSRSQNELNVLKDKILTTLNLSLFIVVPINIFILFFCDEIILTVLNEKWIPMSFYLRILCISSLLYIFTNLHYNVFKSIGKTKDLFKSELTKRIIGMLIISVTVWFGIRIMVVGLLVFSVIEFIVGSYFLGRNLPISFFNQLNEGRVIIFVSLISACSALLLTTFLSNLYVRLIVGGLLFGFSYILLSFLLKEKGLLYILKTIKSHEN